MSVQVSRERDRGEIVLAVRVRCNLISANLPGNNVAAVESSPEGPGAALTA